MGRQRYLTSLSRRIYSLHSASFLIHLVIIIHHQAVLSAEQERAPLECKRTTKGAEYKGLVSVSEEGLHCQRWDSQIPHAHSYISDYLFPDHNASLAANHCRNPAGVKDRPWCYTSISDTRWQYCDVPDCGCRKSKAGWDYAGKISVTMSGRRCQRWALQTPHAQSYNDNSAFPDPSVDAAANFCRNPDRWETKGPWCYTSDPYIRWEYCNVPYCECKVSRGGHQYGGKISRTISGRTCQRWDSQSPHAHRYTEKECGFPEETVSDAANYCRNPEPNELEGPWCFTSDPNVRWEYCDISMCGADVEGYTVLRNKNTTLPIVATTESMEKNIGSLSQVEFIFLGLFATSLLLTMITIVIAMIVVRMYKKRSLNRKCPNCFPDSCRSMNDNLTNLETIKRQDLDNVYDHGEFGDTVYIQQSDTGADPCDISMFRQYHPQGILPELRGSPHCPPSTMSIHTYDSILSAQQSNSFIRPSTLTFSARLKNPDGKPTPVAHVSPHGPPQEAEMIYENTIGPSCHVVITPKSGKKEMKFDRRNSVS